MNRPVFLLYYEAGRQQPDPIIRLLPGLSLLSSPAELNAALRFECLLTFVQAKGQMRQEAIRMLCRQKKDFAMLGLEKADLELARKKKPRLCWLGSLRFFQAAARAKELLQSGCCGKIFSCESEIGKTAWKQYQINDLVNWLLQDQEKCQTKFSSNTSSALSVKLHCDMAQLEITLGEQHKSSLRLKLESQKERSMGFNNSPALCELGLLLKLCQENKPWPLLAKPWETAWER